jgi:hypothetical protein
VAAVAINPAPTSAAVVDAAAPSKVVVAAVVARVNGKVVPVLAVAVAVAAAIKPAPI